MLREPGAKRLLHSRPPFTPVVPAMIQRPLACALAFALIAGLAAPDADAQKRRRSGKAKAPAAAAGPTACTDFYATANADWLKANPLPAGAGSVSALEQLAARARQQEIDLLDASMTAPQGNVQKLLGDFWASGLDEAAVERDGAQPIAPLLSRINAIKRAKDVPASIAALHQVGIPVAFNFSADVDLRDLSRHIGYFTQGGLGLPDPAYYTRTDADTRAVMQRYDAYVQKILALTGTPANRLAAEAKQVVDLETRIARASKPLADLRDPRATFAPVATKDLAKSYRNLQLAEFLKAQGVSDDTVSINAPLFAELDKLVPGIKPNQWKAYLRWRVGDAMAPYLAKAFRDASFEFRGRVLQGLPAPLPRQQQVLAAINLAAGPMLGREYVERHLPRATRARAEELASQVRAQLVAAIARDPRLSAAAKAEAQAKLEGLKIEIGAPRRDLDYSVQPMGRGSFGGNMLIASTWRHREEMKRIGRGNADRRWDVLPQQPSLAYDLAQNRLIVTAAMLQPPVFDVAAAPAAQFGAYGALVGHELTHAVDSRGRYVNAGGEVATWWTPTEIAAWEQLGTKVAQQYSAFDVPVLRNIKVNGAQVRDEAIADLSGTELAWAAFTAAQPQADAGAKQAFYRAWAGLWAQQLSADVAAQRAASGVHAPGVWRTNAPLMQQPAFGATYGCKPGQPMQLPEAQRIRLWQ
ncbi:M13 family metallopeptidase [Tolypothrix campylonemoides VB511288]|nr:M13 family metallopeptidase [Tolypothrix campylonemoides VB511288]